MGPGSEWMGKGLDPSSSFTCTGVSLHVDCNAAGRPRAQVQGRRGMCAWRCSGARLPRPQPRRACGILRSKNCCRRPTTGKILQLVGELEALQAESAASRLSGVWEVVWSDGALTWRALVSRAVQRIGGRCRAGQAFDVSSGRALNWAELWEGRCIITAQGRFQAASGSNGKRGRRSLGACPVPYQVAIEEGSLMVGERSWELPISGPGRFEVLYGDAKLRIFRSAGGLAVQVPSDFEI
eukprot:jgi/Tetstr1/442525/TSEL_030623.t1